MSSEVAKVEGSRLTIDPKTAASYEIDPKIWRALVNVTFPNAKDPRAVCEAYFIAKQNQVDIIGRPGMVHIVPIWNSQLKREVETVWVGIGFLRVAAHRSGCYLGCDFEFGPLKSAKFEKYSDKNRESYELEYPEWCKCIVKRQVGEHEAVFSETVYFEEAVRTDKGGNPNSMWQTRTRGQLKKCAEAAALRMAFPEFVSNYYTDDEIHEKVIDSTVAKPAPTESVNPNVVDADFETVDQTETESSETETEGEKEKSKTVNNKGKSKTKTAEKTTESVKPDEEDDKVATPEDTTNLILAAIDEAVDIKALESVMGDYDEDLKILPKAMFEKVNDAQEQKLKSFGESK